MKRPIDRHFERDVIDRRSQYVGETSTKAASATEIMSMTLQKGKY